MLNYILYCLDYDFCTLTCIWYELCTSCLNQMHFILLYPLQFIFSKKKKYIKKLFFSGWTWLLNCDSFRIMDLSYTVAAEMMVLQVRWKSEMKHHPSNWVKKYFLDFCFYQIYYRNVVIRKLQLAVQSIFTDMEIYLQDIFSSRSQRFGCIW